MSNPNAMMRTILWWAHLLVGFLIGAFVYTPARDSEAYVLLMQAAVVPAVTLTGGRKYCPNVASRRDGPRASDAGPGGAREKHECPLPAPKPRGKADVLKHDRHDEGRTP